MYKLDSHRSFAHGRGNTLQTSGPDIPDREDAWKTCFEQIRGAVERPCGAKVCAGLDELLGIERHAPAEPRRIGAGAGHKEKVPDLMDLATSVLGVSPANTRQVGIA